MRPLAIDLYCGLGGWAEGFLAEGYRVIGFDIEAHDYGTGGYPGELVLRDVLTLNGAEVADAVVIVASPPCQAYSYRAMPWKRAKALPPPDNALFEACFRIRLEASIAAGRRIPLVIENVQGARRWVGWTKSRYGSYYLWGDVPPLPPVAARKVSGFRFDGESHGSCQSAAVKTVGHLNKRDGYSHTRHLTNQREHLKVPGIKLSEIGFNVAAARRIDARNKPKEFKQTPDMKRQHIGYSRKAASAMIAKIPFPLAQHIARCFKPTFESVRSA